MAGSMQSFLYSMFSTMISIIAFGAVAILAMVIWKRIRRKKDD